MIKLEKGEKVLYEIRRHWYILLAESAFLILFFFIPWAILAGLDVAGFTYTTDNGALFTFFAAGWLLSLWIMYVIIWTNYYLDVWIVTNRRIIDVEQHSLFSRDVSEFRLDRIQDVTIEIKGLLPTLLRFGDIHVQTAGETREFIIRHIPHPYDVKESIVRAHNASVQRSRNRDGHS